jgi:hypothetical protein
MASGVAGRMSVVGKDRSSEYFVAIFSSVRGVPVRATITTMKRNLAGGGSQCSATGYGGNNKRPIHKTGRQTAHPNPAILFAEGAVGIDPFPLCPECQGNDLAGDTLTTFFANVT